MIKRRLKIQYVWILIGLFAIIPTLIIATAVRTNLESDIEEPEYIYDEVVEDSFPVINTKTTVINPYIDQDIEIGKTYYDYQGEEESQLKSIITHDNTYLQNTGIDFIREKTFDVVSILDGTVADVKDDETVGKTIEIKHENGYVSIYQSLSEVNVKKGELVNQGQIIGKSGTNELDKELGNHLHFEIYVNGQAVNPENYLNKEISTKEEN